MDALNGDLEAELTTRDAEVESDTVVHDDLSTISTHRADNRLTHRLVRADYVLPFAVAMQDRDTDGLGP